MRYDGAMKKRMRWTGGIIAIAIIALQFFNPPHENPSVKRENDLMAAHPPPPAVAALLKNSCYDCHSSETKWPWYSYIAPVSWYIVRDVNAGRAVLNFSDWPQDDPKRVRKRWRHIGDEVEGGEMPPANYTRIHRQTLPSEQQRADLAKWVKEQTEE